MVGDIDHNRAVINHRVPPPTKQGAGGLEEPVAEQPQCPGPKAPLSTTQVELVPSLCALGFPGEQRALLGEQRTQITVIDSGVGSEIGVGENKDSLALYLIL